MPLPTGTMKSTECINSGETQLTGKTITRFFSKLKGGNAGESGNDHVFPTRHLTGALIITAVAVAWASWNFPQLSGQMKLSGLISIGLLITTFVAWVATARAVFRYHRGLLD